MVYQWPPSLRPSKNRELNTRIHRDCLWPYHPEHTQSYLISEAKQHRAWFVLGWRMDRDVQLSCPQKSYLSNPHLMVHPGKVGDPLLAPPKSYLKED